MSSFNLEFPGSVYFGIHIFKYCVYLLLYKTCGYCAVVVKYLNYILKSFK